MTLNIGHGSMIAGGYVNRKVRVQHLCAVPESIGNAVFGSRAVF